MIKIGWIRASIVCAWATVASAFAEDAELRAEYLELAAELARVEAYNAHLATLVEDQTQTLALIAADAERVDALQTGLGPLLNQMLDTLSAFVAADKPVYLTTRQQTLDALRALIARADVPLAEKYGQLVAAYQAEIDLGRALHAYRSTQVIDGAPYAVNVLAVGRLVLAVQTEDGQLTRFWDSSSDTPGWVALSDDYVREVEAALRIAKRQAAPALIRLPVALP